MINAHFMGRSGLPGPALAARRDAGASGKRRNALRRAAPPHRRPRSPARLASVAKALRWHTPRRPPFLTSGPESAVKWAFIIETWYRCVALELAPKVRVNSLVVGYIVSPLAESLYTQEQLADIVEVTPLRRMGTYEEVAAAVRFFASEVAAFVTGQTLIVDGGRVMR